MFLFIFTMVENTSLPSPCMICVTLITQWGSGEMLNGKNRLYTEKLCSNKTFVCSRQYRLEMKTWTVHLRLWQVLKLEVPRFCSTWNLQSAKQLCQYIKSVIRICLACQIYVPRTRKSPVWFYFFLFLFFSLLCKRQQTQIYSYRFRSKCFCPLEEVGGFCIIGFETRLNSRCQEDSSFNIISTDKHYVLLREVKDSIKWHF